MKVVHCVIVCVSALLMSSACMKPLARFSMSAEHSEAPATIKFMNESTGAEAYLWDFGDGTQSTETATDHTYPHSGKYVVSLTAKKETNLIS